MDEYIVVRLEKNGTYWRAAWREDGAKKVRSLGHQKKLSKTKAQRKCREVERELNAPERHTEPEPTAPTISEWYETFIAQRPLKPTAVKPHTDAKVALVKYFGDIPVNQITPAGAAQWRKEIGKGRSESTVCKLVRQARAQFAEAVDQEILPKNPFRKLKGAPPDVDKDWEYIDDTAMQAILDQCPSHRWRCLFALCRWAGLRVGEAFAMRWERIDWEAGRITVIPQSGRTTTKERRRVVPMEPRLRQILQAAFDAAPAGSPGPWDSSVNNVYRTPKAILKRAGVPAYKKPFHTLRKNRETDWAQDYPAYVVATWMGHSIAVSMKHYLQVPEELFAAVARPDGAPGTEEVQNRYNGKFEDRRQRASDDISGDKITT